MKIGVLGTGAVGPAIATKLVEVGHQVTMGSRTADNPQAAEWAAGAGSGATHGTFADAAGTSELVFNCTAGAKSIEALHMAEEENLADKILVDVANALDFSQGRPPILAVSNTGGLGEEIQRSFPRSKVVKTLNTMNCEVMVDPASLPGGHDVFMAGNDADAKGQVAELLRSFGWPSEHIIDLGDISGARGMEMYLPLWLSLMGVAGGASFNIRVVR